jgi:hypothetical protein
MKMKNPKGAASYVRHATKGVVPCAPRDCHVVDLMSRLVSGPPVVPACRLGQKALTAHDIRPVFY